jgi:cytochrome c
VTRSRMSLLPSVLAIAGAALAVSVESRQAARGGGAFTLAQAERGKKIYEESCSSCHGPALRGGANEFAAPPLVGPFFFEKWKGRPVQELFRYAADNMPPGDMRLPEASSLDVTAYILQVLKYEPGDAELQADSPMMNQGLEPKP